MSVTHPRTHTYMHMCTMAAPVAVAIINTQIQMNDCLHQVCDIKVKQMCIPVTVFVRLAIITIFITDTHTKIFNAVVPTSMA